MSQRINQMGNQNISWDKWKWKHSILELIEYSKSNCRRKVYRNKCLHLKQREREREQEGRKGGEKKKERKVSSKQPNFIPQVTSKLSPKLAERRK